MTSSRSPTLVLASRTEKELGDVCRFVAERGGQAMPVVCDVTDAGQVERMFVEADERFGPVDVLVNNAGAVVPGALGSLPREAWELMLSVNMTAPFLCAQAALRRMVPRRRGVIVNVASVAGMPGVEKLPGLVGYSATKAGLIGFSEALAAEVQTLGIRVVSVSPGSVNTRMLQGVAPDFAAQAMTPGKVGKVIAFLASDAAEGVTQANVPVWGMPKPEEPPQA